MIGNLQKKRSINIWFTYITFIISGVIPLTSTNAVETYSIILEDNLASDEGGLLLSFKIDPAPSGDVCFGIGNVSAVVVHDEPYDFDLFQDEVEEADDSADSYYINGDNGAEGVPIYNERKVLWTNSAIYDASGEGEFFEDAIISSYCDSNSSQSTGGVNYHQTTTSADTTWVVNIPPTHALLGGYPIATYLEDTTSLKASHDNLFNEDGNFNQVIASLEFDTYIASKSGNSWDQVNTYNAYFGDLEPELINIETPEEDWVFPGYHTELANQNIELPAILSIKTGRAACLALSDGSTKLEIIEGENGEPDDIYSVPTGFQCVMAQPGDEQGSMPSSIDLSSANYVLLQCGDSVDFDDEEGSKNYPIYNIENDSGTNGYTTPGHWCETANKLFREYVNLSNDTGNAWIVSQDIYTGVFECLVKDGLCLNGLTRDGVPISIDEMTIPEYVLADLKAIDSTKACADRVGNAVFCPSVFDNKLSWDDVYEEFNLNAMSPPSFSGSTPDPEITYSNYPTDIYSTAFKDSVYKDIFYKEVYRPNNLLCNNEEVDVYVEDHNGHYTGTSAREVIYGTDEADTINGGGGADVICGNGGNDVITLGNTAGGKVFGGKGNDTITGGSARDELHGEDDIDTIFGGGGNDYIYGEAGADILAGGHGADTISGGPDNDTIYGNKADNFLSTKEDAQDGNDILSGDSGADIIYGHMGNDRIYGNNNDNVSPTEDGNDTLVGGRGDDKIYGHSGNDIILGGYGNDSVLNGGEGNDVISGYSGVDYIYGEAGDDWLFGGYGNDEIIGGYNSDHIYGGPGSDTLKGDRGNNDGVGSSDYIYGDHRLQLTGDYVFELQHIFNSNEDYKNNIIDSDANLSGGDTIRGEGQGDYIFGGKGEDFLYGGSGSDTIEGGDNRDIIDGGSGADTCSGGNGNDSKTNC